MSVRKIPKNHIHVTGRHATQKSKHDAEFESPLEADHLLLLDHDPRVKTYTVQPIKIPVPGVPSGYVPDVLVEFHPNDDGVIPASEVREVKSVLDLKVNRDKYAPKFAAAKAYCEERGWVFKIITDEEIRIPSLGNVKFVRAYTHQQHPPERTNQVLKRISSLGPTNSTALLNSLSTDQEAQLGWMPVMWHLVANRKIGVDWDVPFGSTVKLWPLES